VAGGAGAESWFDMSTLEEPCRIEGKKTMGLEPVEQLGWTLPDAIVYPTGGGTGLIGMWKAFSKLRAIGWLEGPLPRMVAVQAEGCDPNRASVRGRGGTRSPVGGAHTVGGDPGFRRRRRLPHTARGSGERGFAASVSDESILAARAEVARRDGLLLCPEGAATCAAWREAVANGRISAGERVVLFNCATGLKYPLPPVTRKFRMSDA